MRFDTISCFPLAPAMVRTSHSVVHHVSPLLKLLAVIVPGVVLFETRCGQRLPFSHQFNSRTEQKFTWNQETT
jgi:hypothetical protein